MKDVVRHTGFESCCFCSFARSTNCDMFEYAGAAHASPPAAHQLLLGPPLLPWHGCHPSQQATLGSLPPTVPQLACHHLQLPLQQHQHLSTTQLTPMPSSSMPWSGRMGLASCRAGVLLWLCAWIPSCGVICGRIRLRACGSCTSAAWGYAHLGAMVASWQMRWALGE